MQPTYLPWSGYFNLMQQVDVFVLLDDVQFERRSWQTRNRILLHGKEHLLTVPVRKAPQSTLLSNILVDEHSGWQMDHWKTLCAAYGKAPHGNDLLSLLEPVYKEHAPDHLSKLNSRVITTIADALDISTCIVSASELGCPGKRTQHLIEICALLDCNEYLSPQGSREYLEADAFEKKSSITLFYQNFSARPYRQYRSETFVSHLSVVDVIANEGIKFSMKYIHGA